MPPENPVGTASSGSVPHPDRSPDRDPSVNRTTIARRAGLVALGTLASRILGAVRDAVIAASFAVGATDAFFVAFTIPNALRVLLGEGAVSGAFVPVFTEVRERHGLERARRFFAALSGAMLVVLLVVTVIGIVAAPTLVTLYAAGYRSDPARFDVTVTLTRLVFPYIFLMGIAALGVGALNAMQRFLVPAFAPTLLNVAMIAAPFLLVPVATSFGMPAIAALAFGALLGGVLQMLAQFPPLARVSLLAWPRFDFRDPFVRKAFRLLVPLLAGLGVYQLNVMLSRLFASFLPAGSQSYLYYGQRLVEIPQGMFALAIATATLPTLSALQSRGDHEEVRRLFRYSLRLSLFVALPASVLLFLLAEPTVAVVFGRGHFEAREIAETARSLRWQAIGIWAVAAVRTTVPVFHAYNDTRTPVVASALNLGVFVLASFLLMRPMEHAGIAAAISFASIAQLAALLVLLRRRTGSIGLGEVARSLGKAAVASAIAGAFGFVVTELADFSRGGNDPRNIATLLVAIGGAALVYLGTAHALRADELGDVTLALRRRLRRGKP